MLTIVWFFGCAGNNFLREVKPILVISISQELISWFLVRIKEISNLSLVNEKINMIER